MPSFVRDQGLDPFTRNTIVEKGCGREGIGTYVNACVDGCGKEVRLSAHATWNKQCIGGESPDLTFIHEPAHGHIEVRSESFQLSHTASGSCDGATVFGKVVYYIPNSDYFGQDRVDYSVVSRYRTYMREVSIEVN